MLRLFGTPEAFCVNGRQILERRLSHLVGVDPTLIRLLSKDIGDLPDDPIGCLAHVRDIEDRAFELIWEVELKRGKMIPSEYLSEW